MDINIRSISELQSVIARIDSGLVMIASVMILSIWASARAGFRLPAMRDIKPMGFVVFVGVVLRLYHIDEAMWYDETFSAAMASIGSPAQLFDAILADVHPPLYYFVLWATANLLDTSEIALRMPAFALGIISIILMYHVSMSLHRKHSVALLTAGIVAILPAHIYYSVEARGYMLMVVLVQLAIMSSLRGRRWAFVFSIALLPLVHSYGYLYAAALMAGWLAARRSALLVIIGIVPGLLWLPYLILQTNNVTSGFWVSSPAPASVLMPLATMTTMQFGIAEAFVTTTGALILSALGLIQMVKMSRRKLIIWLAVVAGVPAMALILSIMIAPVWLPRALLPVTMMIIPAWAVAIIESRRLAAWIAIITIPVATVAFAQHGSRDDIRSWINDCRGDQIYTLSVSTAIQAHYYSSGRDTYIWVHADDMSQTLPHEIQAMLGLIVTDYPPDGDVCIILQYMPYTLTAGVESHMFELLFGQDHRRFVRTSSSHYRFVAYEVSYER